MERNWAGNHPYGATMLHRPAALEQLQEVVARARRGLVVGLGALRARPTSGPSSPIPEASAHVHFHGDADNSLLRVRLDFDDGTGVRFGSASDGQSLPIDDLPLETDDTEQYGRTEVRTSPVLRPAKL
jgi:hypothetical protein